ncbi:hypothetical protein [Psychrobacter urativorans]|uniref:Uncharacterized protein n=1 Tax=Psychrobacter urativorans TaxID=45610 RepID=A0A0M4U427_9GAMM|nr:hypothetical protein [Psychrobacter urativorans]ALF59331.1 hypothetical protein AOC03_04085 [Psychrobacter urativorans]
MKINKFVLAEATIGEVEKQLKLNILITVVLLFVLSNNIVHFMRAKSFFYAALTVAMMIALFFVIKSRQVLKLKKQALLK